MKCPECEKAGVTSTFHEGRLPTDLKATVERFFDEGGKKHVHDHTMYGVVMTCSNGHAFEQNWQSRCPQKACDWNSRDEVVAGTKPIGG